MKIQYFGTPLRLFDKNSRRQSRTESAGLHLNVPSKKKHTNSSPEMDYKDRDRDRQCLVRQFEKTPHAIKTCMAPTQTLERIKACRTFLATKQLKQKHISTPSPSLTPKASRHLPPRDQDLMKTLHPLPMCLALLVVLLPEQCPSAGANGGDTFHCTALWVVASSQV